MVKKYFRNIIFSLIVTIAGGYSVHLLTKQDKPQEIKSQGNSSIVNNIKDNNGVIHNHNNTFINTILNNTTFINIIFNNTPTLPVSNTKLPNFVFEFAECCVFDKQSQPPI